MNYINYAHARKIIDEAINVCGNERASSAGTVFPYRDTRAREQEISEEPSRSDRRAEIEANRARVRKFCKRPDPKRIKIGNNLFFISFTNER